jgi:ABC-type glutathione transport system ATPase component
MAEPILELRDVKTHFPVTQGFIFKRPIGTVKAVDGVSLTIGRGEVVGLVGESGCGKSTLARTIMQLLPTTAGAVILEGRNLTTGSLDDVRGVRRDLQMVFQDPYASLNPRMTVFDTLAEPLRVHEVCPAAEVSARVSRLMELVGLAPAFCASTRTNFPAVNASASRLPALWRWSPRSSLPTSQCPHSMCQFRRKS